MKRIILVLFCAVLCCSAAYGWGRKGHAAIARIAETRLTKTTLKRIAEIMHGEAISGYASYADEQDSTPPTGARASTHSPILSMQIWTSSLSVA